MVDASPPKWHLAHTTWFFETFLLKPCADTYRPFDERFEYLFNSYYNAVGEQFPRSERGRLSRPTLADVLRYRAHVDAAMARLLDCVDDPTVTERVVLGLHHEQQHQELIVTDLKYNLGHNPLYPRYEGARTGSVATDVPPHRFIELEGGLMEVGVTAQPDRFAFDNEQPRHRVLVGPCAIGSRLTSNGEYLDFIEDGGYQRPELWLSEGWNRVRSGALGPAPLYWRAQDGAWFEYQLGGLAALDNAAPVTHVSFFEADAFARWRDARLPTEFEWECFAVTRESSGIAEGRFADDGWFHPRPADGEARGLQLFGDAWEWTASPYTAYPGFRTGSGALGEYNGKFMSGQMVLRGGSCATPRDHIRATYRNFFYPGDRWQFFGIRLARDL
jgi:ergothioneine biosynthesis protein EgtB